MGILDEAREREGQRHHETLCSLLNPRVGPLSPEQDTKINSYTELHDKCSKRTILHRQLQPLFLVIERAHELEDHSSIGSRANN